MLLTRVKSSAGMCKYPQHTVNSGDAELTLKKTK